MIVHTDSGWTERLTVGAEVYVYRPWQGRSDPDGYSIGAVARITPTQVRLADGDAYIRGGDRHNEGSLIGVRSGIYKSYIYPKNTANDRWLEALKANLAAEAARRRLRESVIFAANRCTDDAALNRALTILGEHAE